MSPDERLRRAERGESTPEGLAAERLRAGLTLDDLARAQVTDHMPHLSHPFQPVGMDGDVLRFKRNGIVSDLLDGWRNCDSRGARAIQSALITWALGSHK